MSKTRLGGEEGGAQAPALRFGIGPVDRRHAASGTANIFSPPSLFLLIVILTQRRIRIKADAPMSKSRCVLEFGTCVKCIVLKINH